MSGKLNTNIGFSLLPFAFIFLFDPFYTIYDFLPDFIGYIIILIAIIKLADINDRMKDAFRGFRKIAIINFLRIPAAFFIRTLFADQEKSLGILIFTFAFSLAELLFAIPAFKNFFEALLGLGLTHDGFFVCFEKKKGKRTVTERKYALTVWFLLLKNLSSTIPEFTTLINNDSYTFVLFLRVFGILASLTFGIVWLINVFRYCVKINRDLPFIEALSVAYANFHHNNKGLYISRNITSAIYLIIAAAIFSIDFYVQYINVLPDGIFYLLLFAAAFMLKKYTRRATPLFVICPLGVVASVTSLLTAKSFYGDYYPHDILKNVRAYDRFYTMLGVNIAESVVLLLAVFFAVFMLIPLCREHTDIFTGSNKRSKIFVFVPLVFLCITGAVSTPFYIASQPFYYVGKWYFEYAAMIAVTFSITFAVCAYCYLNSMINSVKTNYKVLD